MARSGEADQLPESFSQMKRKIEAMDYQKPTTKLPDGTLYYSIADTLSRVCSSSLHCSNMLFAARYNGPDTVM